ncbi:MAG: hypothetical protein ABR973_16135 [Candidatus Acidiferrales bacterium]|jgi:hypothetical protein
MPEEFEWNDSELYGFLANRLGSEDAAADAIAEADEKETATRTIECGLGSTSRIVFSPMQD